MSVEDCIEVRPEDRIALRRALSAEARLDFAAGVKGSSRGIVTDLSVHGLWVAVNRPLPLGASIEISFRPAEGFEELSLEATVARVDWHEGGEAVMGMGLSFVALDADEQRVLEDALKGLPAREPKGPSPVIAVVEHDSLEDEVEQILEDEDLDVIEESGVRAIPAPRDAADEEFELIDDEELEVFVI
jgi:hypothetical protein